MKYQVVIHLTPDELGRETFSEEFDTQSDALKFAQSAACTAHCRSNGNRAIFYPAHRVEFVELIPLED
jgi:hypothetical protein